MLPPLYSDQRYKFRHKLHLQVEYFIIKFNIELLFALLQGPQGETGGGEDRGVYSLWLQRMFWIAEISLEVLIK